MRSCGCVFARLLANGVDSDIVGCMSCCGGRATCSIAKRHSSSIARRNSSRKRMSVGGHSRINPSTLVVCGASGSFSMVPGSVRDFAKQTSYLRCSGVPVVPDGKKLSFERPPTVTNNCPQFRHGELAGVADVVGTSERGGATHRRLHRPACGCMRGGFVETLMWRKLPHR